MPGKQPTGRNSERTMLADAIDDIDAQIKVLNKSKSEAYKAHREKLEGRGMDARRASAEVEAIKAAVARRRKYVADPNAFRERDDLTDEILDEIMGPSRAREERSESTTPNASSFGGITGKSREVDIAPDHDPETGEIHEPASHVAAAVGGDGAGASVSTDTYSENNNGGPNESARSAEVTNWRRRSTDDDHEDTHHDMGASPRPVNASEEPGRSLASDTPPKPVNDDFARIQVIGSINE